MANILDRYGIKEVADVTFYKINADNPSVPGAPVLFLDTLKVSTIEQTAEQAEARGGKGNPPLIIWDYGKEITVTLEDALFSAKSMAIMFGGDDAIVDQNKETTKIYKTWARSLFAKELEAVPATLEYGTKLVESSKCELKYYKADGSDAANFKDCDYMTGVIPVSEIGVIEISANTFPGTYYVTGDTYARSEITGEDEFFQFIIPKAKMNAENTITLEAEGDPSVFNMTLRVLRPADGKMMKLVKYNITEATANQAEQTQG